MKHMQPLLFLLLVISANNALGQERTLKPPKNLGIVPGKIVNHGGPLPPPGGKSDRAMDRVSGEFLLAPVSGPMGRQHGGACLAVQQRASRRACMTAANCTGGAPEGWYGYCDAQWPTTTAGAVGKNKLGGSCWYRPAPRGDYCNSGIALSFAKTFVAGPGLAFPAPWRERVSWRVVTCENLTADKPATGSTPALPPCADPQAKEGVNKRTLFGKPTNLD